MAKVDATARVADGAKLGADVVIGPYCVIGPQVSIGDGCHLTAHVSIQGITDVGSGAKILPFASLGSPPQSVHYKGEPSRLIVGKNCDIREGVTMNTGTAGGRMETRVGDNCMFMTGAHVAHDCIVGNNVVFANCATLGGHAEVGDFVFMGGFGAMIQFGKIGEHAMIGGMAAVRRDVIPFGLTGINGTLDGLNLVGLKRRGFTRSDVQILRDAYRTLFYGSGNFAERVESVANAYAEHAGVQKIISFIRNAGKRGVSMPTTHKEED